MRYIVKKPFGNVKVGEVLEKVNYEGSLIYKNSNMSPVELALMLNAGFLEESYGKWRPNTDDKYWFIYSKCDGCIEVESDCWCNFTEDFQRSKVGNCFQTKELAEAKLAEIKEVLSK